ncbi:MAG: hypothetical protein V5A47_00710 [Bacteroidales bacterium]|nr:hypothetical protein [Bacteroidales bacterium]MBS3773594.1 hypothetical protein [Bacteroidales bacterium]
MKAYCFKITLLLLLFMIPVYLFSQDTTNTSPDTLKQSTDSSETKDNKFTEEEKKQRADTIQMFEDDPMYVNVLKITYDSIIYTEVGDSDLRRLGKDRVHKIIYNWGRVETLNESPPKYPGRYNWRKVKILKNKNNTQGLYKVKEIQAKVEGSSRGYDTPKSLEMRAETILKKKAANINAQFVLITNKNITIAFGELPSATFKGIAYSKDKKVSQNGEEE